MHTPGYHHSFRLGRLGAVLSAALMALSGCAFGTQVAGHPRQPTATVTPTARATLSPSSSPFVTPPPLGVPTFASYPLPNGVLVSDMVLEPDRAVWFTDVQENRIGRIDGAGQVTFPVKLAQWSVPSHITGGPPADSSGRGAIWFTESNANKIGRFTLDTGELREYTVPTPRSGPRGITAGSDGAIWFTEQVGNKIGRLTLDGQFSEFQLPNRGDVQCGNVCPEDITAGLDGALWFTESQLSMGGGNRIGRITTSGQLSEYEIPTQNSQPTWIGVGGDNALWFTESRAPRLGRISLDGQLSELPVPGNTSGVAIGGLCRGPFHRIVFTVLKPFAGTTGGSSIGVASPTTWNTPPSEVRLYAMPGETALLGPIAEGEDNNIIWAAGQDRIWEIRL